MPRALSDSHWHYWLLMWLQLAQLQALRCSAAPRRCHCRSELLSDYSLEGLADCLTDWCWLQLAATLAAILAAPAQPCLLLPAPSPYHRLRLPPAGCAAGWLLAMEGRGVTLVRTVACCVCHL